MSRSAVALCACFATLFLAFGCGEVSVEDATGADLATGEDAAPDTAAADTAPDTTTTDVVGGECETNFDCNDKVKGKTPCILAACVNGFCTKQQKPAGDPCTDQAIVPTDCGETRCDAAGQCVLANKPDATACGGLQCGQKCEGGQCVPATDADYDDGNPCTKDFCDQGIKVRHDPITDLTLPCDDGDSCTSESVCIEGGCNGTPIDCSDGLACTVDTCSSETGCAHTADAKLCDDGNPCTVDGCDLAAGCTVTGFDAGKDCDDGNDCTTDTACAADGECVGTSTCACATDDDCVSDNKCLGKVSCVANKCQADPALAVKCPSTFDTACLQNVCDKASGQCQPTPQKQGEACDDADPCTTKSTCEQGLCAGAADAVCDDGNPCTNDACVPQKGCVFEPNAATCDDGNACTTADACDKGACAGLAKKCGDDFACTLDGCDKATGACTKTPDDKLCDDNNPCTKDSCDPAAGCKSSADDAGKCDDGDACTNDTCQAGKCVSVNTCPCKVETQAKDCDDNNPCTVDSCDLTAKKCKNEAAGADGKACDTADKCQEPGSGVCAAGVCKSGNKPKNCGSLGDACNVGTCDPASGTCVKAAKADNTPCDADGNGCTGGDACKAGKCTAGGAIDCSAQADTCNTAACKSTSATAYTCAKTPKAKGEACDDGQYCTAAETCDGAGKCTGGAIKTCAEVADACNSGTCDETKDQCVKVAKASTVACNDGLYCTTGDHCDGKGACTGGGALSCPGGNCLAGKCDEAADKCTTEPVSGNFCTDGNACTTEDICDATGKCVGGKPVTCTGDACNDSLCNTGTGKCEAKPKATGTACNDGNACTSNDACATGVCKGTYTCACTVQNQATDCDDKNPCTKDTCVLTSGVYKCQNTPSAGVVCDDKDPCTQKSTCSSTGSCVGSDPVVCKGDACNSAVCDGSSGVAQCKLVPLAAGTACSDGLFCTGGNGTDACDGYGKCKGAAVQCSPSTVACKSNVCLEAAQGCTLQAQPKGTTCSDGNACTSGETCDGAGTCSAGSSLPDFAACNDGSSLTSGDLCYANVCKGFQLSYGPAGPVSAVDFRADVKGWQLTAGNGTMGSLNTTGDWRIWSLVPAKGGGYGFVSQLDDTAVEPYRDISGQVAVRSGGKILFAPSGSTVWQTSSNLSKAVSTSVATGFDWQAVSSRQISGTLHVLLAGVDPAASNYTTVVRCSGPTSGASSFTCNTYKLGSLFRPVGAMLTTSTKFCSPTPCSPTPQYKVANLYRSTTTGAWVSMYNHQAASYTDIFSGYVGPAVSPSTYSVLGDTFAYDTFLTVTGQSLVWMVGPSGHVSYQKAGSGSFYAAQVVASLQSSYAFTAVQAVKGHVLIWGSKPDAKFSASRVPVLLTHKDETNKQSGASLWTEHELAGPAYNSAYCAGNYLGTTGLADSPDALIMAGHACGNTTVMKGAYLKTAIWSRPW